MQPYAWGMNGTTFGNDTPIRTSPGKPGPTAMSNMTMMAHPMHIHGHTWSLPGMGACARTRCWSCRCRLSLPTCRRTIPGKWAYHCHNIYHAEIGMMTTLQY